MKTKLLLIATLLSGLTFSQNALNFDGADDYVQTPFSGVLGSNDRTFEAYIYVPSTAPSSNLTIIDYGVNLSGSRNTFVVLGNKGLGFLSGGTNGNISSPAASVPEDQWVHVAFVLSSGTGYLYVNGIEVGTGNLTGVNTPSGNQTMTIGQRVLGGSIIFNGNIDEVRIWDVARTEVEINTYKDVEFCTLPSGLVSYYKMNQGTVGADNSSLTALTEEVASNDGSFNNFTLNGTSSNFVTGAAISSTFNANQNLTLCAQDSVIVGSNTYDATGIYTDVLTSVLTGCDSTIVTDLTMKLENSFTQVLNECYGSAVTVGSNTYSITGIYNDTLTSVIDGCDSIVNTDLTFKAENSFTQVLYECDGYSITVGSNTYLTTGVYNDILTSVVDGCDSIVTTDLTIIPIDNSTSVSGITITANEPNAVYEWIDCDNGNATISGETEQSFTPTDNGNYAVIITTGTCTFTSECVNINSVGIDELDNSTFKVFPIPATDIINIKIDNQLNNYSIVIRNITGQQVMYIPSTKGDIVLDINALPKGNYFLEVSNEVQTSQYKFIKL